MTAPAVVCDATRETNVPGRPGVIRFKNGLFAANVWLDIDGKSRQVRLGMHRSLESASAAVEGFLAWAFDGRPR